MVEDWKINSQVIAELTRNWVDLKRLNISTVNGVIYIKGLLIFHHHDSKVENPKAILQKQVIEEEKIKRIEKRLKSIEGVKAIRLNFTNWIKEGLRWKRIS
jgi:hypothetical protein